jgi:hypothetical protein
MKTHNCIMSHCGKSVNLLKQRIFSLSELSAILEDAFEDSYKIIYNFSEQIFLTILLHTGEYFLYYLLYELYLHVYKVAQNTTVLVHLFK